MEKEELKKGKKNQSNTDDKVKDNTEIKIK